MEKTVYILGAGFSVPAGAPSQEGILDVVWSMDLRPELEGHRERVREFLRSVLNVDEAQVTLEDIYTPVDRCISDGIGLRGQSLAQLQEIRDSLGYLVSLAIRDQLGTAAWNRSQYVDDFASKIVEMASVRGDLAREATDATEAKAYDPLAIISLNWDILLDNALNSALEANDGGDFSDYDPFGVVDYCCYISSLEAGDKRIRTGLWSLGCRGYNVKLLKVHGSMNWLQCQNCQQLLIGFNEKLTIPNFETPKNCRHCEKQGNQSALRGALVMPTFLKDLSNFQIKLVWQNAAIELMEARRLVFIGYSLPFADFEFRQVLSRMVHKDTKIDVVLWEGTEDDQKHAYQEERKRYESFFSKHEVSFEPKGVLEYVSRM